jgi:hypothetical protein
MGSLQPVGVHIHILLNLDRKLLPVYRQFSYEDTGKHVELL